MEEGKKERTRRVNTEERRSIQQLEGDRRSIFGQDDGKYLQ